MPRKLTDEEVEESLRFGHALSAAAGHVVDRPEADDDIRRVLRGEMTEDEYIRRVLERVTREGDA
jgi:hypothetical protein